MCKKIVQEALDDLLTEIARKNLGLSTLETRKSDRLDFHEHAVWSIKEALLEAYTTGFKNGMHKE